jgi:hypothetical protein
MEEHQKLSIILVLIAAVLVSSVVAYEFDFPKSGVSPTHSSSPTKRAGLFPLNG